MSARVFIDGEAGTTGLQIRARLEGREDIELLRLDESERKDQDRRREMLNAADLAVLCLPDDAAREAVGLIDNPGTRVIDASTAHRTTDGWTYGFPELDGEQRDRIAASKRVANPGCYALASIAILRPLVEQGLLDAGWPVTINAVSGYSGGGKSLIAEFEGSATPDHSGTAYFTYAHTLAHKHLPEITRWSGLEHAPIFAPSVGRFAQGMIVQAPLALWAMPGKPNASDVREALSRHYEGQRHVRVETRGGETAERLDPQSLNGTNDLALYVFANDDSGQALAMGVLDNLGKGASGQAVQNLNIMLGLEESTGL